MERRLFRIAPRGAFSLAASTVFLEGFTPAAYERSAPGHLHLAFSADGTRLPGGACVRQPRRLILVEAFGPADPVAVRDQVRRILSLDADGSGFTAVGRRDPVIRRLQRRYRGLRPVCFNSPYEAAAWSLIGNRIRISQAARIKEAMARELGDPVDIHGDVRHAFPSPGRLATLEGFSGLSGRKAAWLRSLGAAAESGALEAERLRSLPIEEALAELQELPGVGPFSAELTLVRGAGLPDHLPVAEPRLGRAVALAYGLDRPPGPARIRRMAEPWRPYRAWVAVLLRTALEDETGEISRPRRKPALRPRRRPHASSGSPSTRV